MDDPADDVVDVEDGINDVTGAAGTTAGSSVNTSGLPVAADVDPEGAGSATSVEVVAVG